MNENNTFIPRVFKRFLGICSEVSTLHILFPFKLARPFNVQTCGDLQNRSRSGPAFFYFRSVPALGTPIFRPRSFQFLVFLPDQGFREFGSDPSFSFRKPLLDRASVSSFLHQRPACENYPHFSSSLVRSYLIFNYTVVDFLIHACHKKALPRRYSATRTSTATITMAHVRDSSFNPSSPHSSSGGVDSYNYEGTPDTKLTVFSPDENSAKPNRLLTTLGLDGPSSHSAHYHHIGPAEAFGNTSSATAEKDPFVSNTTNKGEQKLSPTASAFRPLSVPLVAHGSLNASPGVNAGLGVNRQLFAPQATAKFSCDLGISRCLVLYSPSFPITVTDAEGYLAVKRPPTLPPSCQLIDALLTAQTEA